MLFIFVVPLLFLLYGAQSKQSRQTEKLGCATLIPAYYAISEVLLGLSF